MPINATAITLYTTETGTALRCILKNESEAADPLFPNLNATYPITDLTGLAPSNLTMYFKPPTGSGTNGTGSFQILSNKNPAQVLYQFASGDVTTAANGIQGLIIVAYTNGPKFYGPFTLTLTQK